MRQAGLALLDCLVYCGLFVLLFGLALVTFLQTLSQSKELDRISTTMVQALQLGEQWRADVRASRMPPRLIDAGGTNELYLVTPSGNIAYAFRDGTVYRRLGSSPTAPWLDLLAGVKASRYSIDARKRVTAWRWEVELARGRQGTGFHRVLTFLAVPGGTDATPVAQAQ